MIPPCDPSILNNNPQFKSLHNHLTTAILDPDGCDRAVEAKPERREVRDVSWLTYLIFREGAGSLTDGCVLV